MKRIEVEWQGRKVSAWVTRDQDRLWLHVAGETWLYETPKKRRGGQGETATDSDHRIVAPMPGKITKVAAQPGAAVVAGQVMLVMEAMKMEYTLKAKISGIVDQVLVAVGEQVGLGQVLASIGEGDTVGKDSHS